MKNSNSIKAEPEVKVSSKNIAFSALLHALRAIVGKLIWMTLLEEGTGGLKRRVVFTSIPAQELEEAQEKGINSKAFLCHFPFFSVRKLSTPSNATKCEHTLASCPRKRPLLLYISTTENALGAILAQDDDDGKKEKAITSEGPSSTMKRNRR
uniref:Uncharacterized protein n=1 Tax=Ananas comosus var. bracteatus TaxID=296719 RepID=A0A6V7PYT2_ANACO|nr:unnamed protein product [Ananas comosus var. bracteatus]